MEERHLHREYAERFSPSRDRGERMATTTTQTIRPAPMAPR
jgi:hypothetical protein